MNEISATLATTHRDSHCPFILIPSFHFPPLLLLRCTSTSTPGSVIQARASPGRAHGPHAHEPQVAIKVAERMQILKSWLILHHFECNFYWPA